MAETINGKNFRTALHGFNREDVVAYIESTALENEKERRYLQDTNVRLQKELEEALAAAAEVKEDPAVREALEAAQAELADARAAAANSEAVIAALRAENTSLTAKNHALEAELSQLREQSSAATPLNAPIPPVAEVIPAAGAPKDYSELELAAYRRAEVTERLARERAADVYRQVRAVFNSAAGRFEMGKNDLDQLTRTLQLDVNQLLQLLSTIRSAYSEAEQSFQAVSDKNRQMVDAEL